MPPIVIPAAVVAVIGILALIFGDRKKPERRILVRRSGRPLVNFTHRKVPIEGRDEKYWPSMVVESPDESRSIAEAFLRRSITPEAFALATMIASEAGRGAPNVKAAVAWAALNRVAELKGKRTLLQILSPDGKFGGQNAPGRGGVYASTRWPPYLQDLEIAELVLAKQIPDETQGAVQFDSPASQRALIARKAFKYDPENTPEKVAANRLAAGKEIVLLPGVDPDYIRFWRRKTAVSGGEMAYLIGSVGSHDGLDPITIPVPRTAGKLAAKWGKVFGVPVSYVNTIVDIESGMVPGKVNMSDRAAKKGGAWGLMQITGDTAKFLKDSIQKSRFGKLPSVRETLLAWDGTGRALLDPELNVMLGTFYLGSIYREFEDLPLVAAAYHTGPAAVREMMSENGVLSLGPFGREYVERAAESYKKFA